MCLGIRVLFELQCVIDGNLYIVLVRFIFCVLPVFFYIGTLRRKFNCLYLWVHYFWCCVFLISFIVYLVLLMDSSIKSRVLISTISCTYLHKLIFRDIFKWIFSVLKLLSLVTCFKKLFWKTDVCLMLMKLRIFFSFKTDAGTMSEAKRATSEP